MGLDEIGLYLENGLQIKGTAFGAKKVAKGELVFSTAMNGYPEALTDPSYKGQILVLTQPHIGNYGVPKPHKDHGILANFESEHIMVEGLVISQLTFGSKWNSAMTLDEWLKKEGVPGIFGVDTRMLVKMIRDRGSMNAVLGDVSKNDLEFEDYTKINFVEQVSTKQPIIYQNKNKRKRIVVVDFGIKHGILAELYGLGYTLIRVPYSYTADKIMEYEPAGIVLSNGPGNPLLLDMQTKTFSDLLEYKMPMLGICLGHQIAMRALGYRISKMKFGHRAINKAVVDMHNGKAYITTHNHGYAVYASDMPKKEIWFMDPDDKTVEGTYYPDKKLMTTQFHPESRPGTNDTKFVFAMFKKWVG